MRSKLDPQRTFRRYGHPVLGRFAVDEKLAAGRPSIRDLRPQAVTFFAYEKQQPDVDPVRAQPRRRRHLGSDNSLGVARASAINATLIFRRRNEWRHGIHVSG